MTPPARPLFHFSPPQGWMNDPNGLVYHEGVYHLFYQYHPESLVWGPMHWGHATTRDLLTWVHLPIALAPDDHGTIFSGSAVWDGQNSSGLVPGGGLVAMFSYSKQTQGIAFSRDQGLSWLKYPGNPVMPALAPDYRDPKVFAHGTGWSMVLAVGKHLEFYSSTNLLNWTKTGEFSADLDVGVWECPDVFPLTSGGRTFWVLLVSVTVGAPNGGSGTLTWVGDFDGAAFQAASAPVWLDQGTDNYAGVTWNHAPAGRRLLIGWMNNWRYAREIPASTWRGEMTLPRLLGLSEDAVPRLLQSPVAELASFRGEVHPIPSGPVEGEVELGNLPVSAEFDFDLTSSEGSTCHLLWRSGAHRVRLTWDPIGTLTLERDMGPLTSFHDHFADPVRLTLGAPGSSLHLQIVTDTHSFEVFADDGRGVLTALVYGLGPTVDVSMVAGGPGVSLKGNLFPLVIVPKA